MSKSDSSPSLLQGLLWGFRPIRGIEDAKDIAKTAGVFGFLYLIYICFGFGMGLLGRNELGFLSSDGPPTSDNIPLIIAIGILALGLTAIFTWRMYTGRGYISAALIILDQIYSIYNLFSDEFMSLSRVFDDNNDAHNYMRVYVGLFVCYLVIEVGALTAFIGGFRSCLYLRRSRFFRGRRVEKLDKVAKDQIISNNVNHSLSPTPGEHKLSDIKEQIESLLAMKNGGLITEAEFVEKKRQLLAKIN